MEAKSNIKLESKNDSFQTKIQNFSCIFRSHGLNLSIFFLQIRLSTDPTSTQLIYYIVVFCLHD